MLSRVIILKPQELDLAEIGRWRAAQAKTPVWNSPFLHPEFAIAVSRRREDTRILVAEDASGRHAWFAFHRRKGAFARPVGAPVSDHQAMVMEPGFAASMCDVLREAGIGALPFSAMAAPTPEMHDAITHKEPSLLIHLENGAEQYFDERCKAHRKHFKKMRQRARNQVRDFGEGELLEANADDELWQTLLAWKHQQFDRTGRLNVLKVPWIHALFENVRTLDQNGLQGRLFGYRINNEWAAAELGLYADGVYHSWLAAYDDRFARVSPGLMLIHRIVAQCHDLDIRQMDLGRGHDHYKKYYANEQLPLAAGCMTEFGSAARQLRLLFGFCDATARLPIGPIAKWPGRIAGSVEYIAACHPQPGEQWRAMGRAIRRKLSRS